MTNNQITSALSVDDVRMAGEEFVATLVAEGKSSVRTREERYASLWEKVEAYVDEERAVEAEVEATEAHEGAAAALEAARADEADKRAALDGAIAYRQAVQEMRKTVGLAMVDMGITGRQTARILGVTEGAVRKWRKTRRAEAEAAAAVEDGAEENGAENGAEEDGAEVTAPTPAEVRRALEAAAALLDGLDPVSSVKVLKSLEARVAKITGALADLQARSAKGARNAA